MSYLVLIFISAIMDAVTVKVYVEKWFGKPPLRISTMAYWGIFILTELASRGGQLFMIDVSQEKAMVSQVSAHIVIMLVFICLYDSRIAECISAFIIWVLGYLVSIGLSDVVVITTDQMLYDGGITHLISVMDMYAQFIMLPVLIIILVVRNYVSGRYSFKQLVIVLITPMISCYLYLIIPEQIVLLSGHGFIFVLIIVLVLNVLNYYQFDNMVDNYKLKNQVAMLGYQLEHQSDKYDQLVLSYKKIGSMVHDTQKHISYIRSCIEEKEYDRIRTVCDRYEEELKNKYVVSKTGNLVIDTFVNSAYTFAQNNGVKFHTDFKFDKNSITVSDYDMCIIIGNLLDNSINACKKQKEKEGVYIKLAIVQTDRHLVIDVKNSSTQSDVGGSKDMTHGYGIQNVKNTMDKYNGIMEIKNTYGEYETLVLIPINQD